MGLVHGLFKADFASSLHHCYFALGSLGYSGLKAYPQVSKSTSRVLGLCGPQELNPVSHSSLVDHGSLGLLGQQGLVRTRFRLSQVCTPCTPPVTPLGHAAAAAPLVRGHPRLCALLAGPVPAAHWTDARWIACCTPACLTSARWSLDRRPLECLLHACLLDQRPLVAGPTPAGTSVLLSCAADRTCQSRAPLLCAASLHCSRRCAVRLAALHCFELHRCYHMIFASAHRLRPLDRSPRLAAMRCLDPSSAPASRPSRILGFQPSCLCSPSCV